MDSSEKPTSTIKTETFFFTIKTHLKWIKNNFVFFIVIVLLFSLLNRGNKMLIPNNNQIIPFIKQFINISIYLGLITTLMFKYYKIKTVDKTKIFRILIIVTFLTIYYVVVTSKINIKNPVTFLLSILSYMANILAVLSIYNIVVKNTKLGMKTSFYMVINKV